MSRFPPLLLLAAVIFALLASLAVRPLRLSSNPFNGVGQLTRVLLLTAHPDDECMFFAPTLLGLLASATGTSRSEITPEIFSLCLSVGNADGLGYIRRDELGRSLDVLGVPSSRRWVEDRRYVCQYRLSIHWNIDVCNEA